MASPESIVARAILPHAPRIRPGATATALAMAGLVISGIAAATAQDASHAIVTTIDLATCRAAPKANDVRTWHCPGLPGYPVSLAEVDDRMFVSVGPSPEKRRAAHQTLNAQNTLFPGANKRATIEWRLPRVHLTGQPAQNAVPYATIVRFFTRRGAARGQVLVVSAVSATDTCQMAFIDADASPDALALARRIADTAAPTFDCTKPPTVEGPADKSPM